MRNRHMTDDELHLRRLLSVEIDEDKQEAHVYERGVFARTYEDCIDPEEAIEMYVADNINITVEEERAERQAEREEADRIYGRWE